MKHLILASVAKKTVCITTAMCLLTACGGRTANPIMASQYGDTKKSCEALEFEIANTESEMNRIIGDTDKTGKNVALGVAGAFLLVPWFFMDFKNAEATEYQALRQRYQHLTSIAIDKNCDVKTRAYPEMRQQPQQEEKPAYPSDRRR